MIIWLASYPRSGNTYFRVLLKEYYGIETDSVYVIEQKSDGLIAKQLGLIRESGASLKALIEDPSISFVKTHNLPSDDYPAVYLVRDGRDALVSHAHLHLQLELKLSSEEEELRFPEMLKTLIESNISFGGWSNNVNAWMSRNSPTAIVKYEALIKQPLATVQKAFAQLQYPLPPLISRQSSSFAELKQIEPKFFRKGKAGSWREEMSPELQELFWEKHGATMQKLGYKRDQNIFERTWARLRHRA